MSDLSRGIRLLHLTDTHIPDPATAGADAALARLDGLLADLAGIDALDLVVVSGDIADDGSAGGAAAVRQRIAAFAAERGMAHVYAPGNNDTRAGFAAAVGSGHRDAADADAALAAFDGEARAAVSETRGLRVITLDSTVPGQMHGMLDPGQLRWLAAQLAAPAPAGTVIVLHHPPLVIPESPFLADALAGGERRGSARRRRCTRLPDPARSRPRSRAALVPPPRLRVTVLSRGPRRRGREALRRRAAQSRVGLTARHSAEGREPWSRPSAVGDIRGGLTARRRARRRSRCRGAR